MNGLRIFGLILAGMWLSPPGEVRGQERQPGATVVGQVTDRQGDVPIRGVVVTLEGLRISALTDTLGYYRLSRVPPGPRVLRLDYLGYATVREPIYVPASGVVERNLEMAVQALELEGITVTADPVGRARGELGTTSVIGEDAIRYQSATSLSGVLELVPGMPMSPPGLEGVQQISLRVVPTSTTSGGTSAADMASFGTLVILDGIPQSNNANLQTLGPRGEGAFASSAGGGIDLRVIPASTIERVEVIRGIPSARYGDLTQGAVVVDTRAGEVEPILAGKLDARSVEGSVVAGRKIDWLGGTGTLVLDLARTQSSPGLTDNRSYRLAGQFAHRVERERDDGGRLVLDTRFDFHRLTDDRPENPNISPEASSESRDTGFRLSERAILERWHGVQLTFTGALATVAQRSSNRFLRVRATTPFTDRLDPGRAVGGFIGGRYVSELSLDGRPWMAYARLEGAADREGLGFSHGLRAGMELRREWNAGGGYQFDMAFPPQSTFNAVDGFDRPRRFDAIPPLVTTGIYLDDALSHTVGGDVVLNLQAGLRLDLLHEGSTWMSSPRDAVWQPRFNAEIQPRPWLRLRGGWGRTAKLPDLASLFPAPQYYDVVNVNWYAADPAERLAVLTTFIEDPTNSNLEMARGEKAEVGFELGLGRSIVSVVGFRDRIRGGFGVRQETSFLLRDRYQLSDSTLGMGFPPEILDPPAGADTVPVLIDRPANTVDIVSRGVELTAMFPEIRSIRTRLQVQGAWIRTERQTDALHFGPYTELSDFQLRDEKDRIPYWTAVRENGWRALATYRVIHQQPEAGLVITATVQHNISDRQEVVGATDTLSFAGYLTRGGSLVSVPQEDRTDPEYSDLRQPRSGVLAIAQSTPGDWLLSAQVSKTLPLDGRLSFWAFNLLGRTGIFGDGDTRPRPYQRMRFGLELSMPTRGLVPW